MSETELTAASEAEAVVEEESSAVVEVRGLVKVFKDFWGRPKAKARPASRSSSRGRNKIP